MYCMSLTVTWPYHIYIFCANHHLCFSHADNGRVNNLMAALWYHIFAHTHTHCHWMRICQIILRKLLRCLGGVNRLCAIKVIGCTSTSKWSVNIGLFLGRSTYTHYLNGTGASSLVKSTFSCEFMHYIQV